MLGEVENAGKRGPGEKEKEWTDCVADDLRLFGVTGDWRTAALDPGAWYNKVHEGGCRFMTAWGREEKMRPINGRTREKRKRRTRLRLLYWMEQWSGSTDSKLQNFELSAVNFSADLLGQILVCKRTTRKQYRVRRSLLIAVN